MFVIVRHGNTFERGETPRRIGARTDLPLTTTGHEQAQALGSYFARQGIRFDHAIVSPLERTRQTAQAIFARQEAALQPEVCEFLREVDYGPDENQPEDAVRARIGQLALDTWEREATPPEGWIVDADTRLAQWRERLRNERGRKRNTLVVASNGSARFALLADPGLSAAAKTLGSLKLPTGGFGILRLNDQGDWSISQWGSRP